MKNVKTLRLVITIWLCLIGWLPILVMAANPTEITTVKQLQEVLSSSKLRSDAVKDLKIVDAGIQITEEVPVGVGSFRMFGGPLIRAEGYKGIMLHVLEGGNISIENTIDGANLEATEVTVLVDKEGSFSMDKNAFIQNVRNNYANIPALKNDGIVLLKSGYIKKCTYNETGKQTYTIVNYGTLLAKGGTVECENTGVSIMNSGKLSLWGVANVEQVCINGFGLTIRSIVAGILEAITIESSLQNNLQLTAGERAFGYERVFRDGDVIAQGSSSYSLQKADMDKIELANTNLSKKIENNKIILYTPSAAIDTPEKLQEAINNSTGTADNPTVITIPQTGLRLTKPIVIDGKYIKLTGGTIWNYSLKGIWMFEVKSGKLIVENIILDGGNTLNIGVTWCEFVFLTGGQFIMNEGAILQHATFTGDFSAVEIQGGTFYMKGGSITGNITKNDAHGQIMRIIGGSFIMEGGRIYKNASNGNPVVLSAKNGFWHYGGSISENGDGDIQLSGSFYHSTSNANDIIDCPITILESSKLFIMKQINVTIRIETSLPDGYVLASGSDGYKITNEDLSKFILPEEYSLELVDNNLILVKGSANVIDTQEKLQAAIDAAQTGSSSNPALITIAPNIEINKTILIKGKYIKITSNNGSIHNVSTSNIRMFEVQSGSLTLENMSLLGTVTGTNAYCSFVGVSSGASLVMTNVTMKNAISDESSWSMLRINGNCTLKNCTISENTGKALIYISKGGKCIIDGGEIKNNICSDSKSTFSLIYNFGQLDYMSGEYTKNHAISISSWGVTTLRAVLMKNYLSSLIKDEGSSVFVYQSVNLYNNERIGDSFFLEKNDNGSKGYINVFEQVKRTIEVVIHKPEEGWVVAKGSDYTLTQADLQKFILGSSSGKGWKLELVDNLILLKNTTISSGIDTQEKLQAAIDASNGSTSVPAEIKIADKEIAITHSILIKDKYVKLIGGTLKNMASADLRMIDVRSGYLGLESITLDGNQKKASGYCTLIEMNGGICEIMEGAKLTNALARGGSDAVVVIPKGKLTLKGGEITGNTSEGGDIVWVSGSGYFAMQAGNIKGNTNNGKYIMAGVEMTYGTMLLTGGQIADNSGMRYGVYATKAFTLGNNVNLKEVVILSGDAKIQIPTAIQNPVTIGYMKSGMPSGTIVATGSSYQLTNVDAKKFAYRYTNTYDFKLDNNNIVLVNLDAANKTFAIKAAAVKGGTISASKTTAKENELITVTVKPDAGKKLYAEMLRYNNNKMTATDQVNTYTFKMPPSDATLTAEFIPDLITVEPDNGDDPETGKDTNPDEHPIPEIGNIGDLIGALAGNGDINPSTPTGVNPNSSPTEHKDLPDPLKGLVNDGEKAGDDVIGSLKQLISIVSKTSDGTLVNTKVISKLPGKIALRMYLPLRLIVSEQLRAAGTANYYILNECDGLISRINPVFDPEANTLTFETDKLGDFVIMNGNSSTANEKVSVNNVIVFVDGNRLSIKGLKPGEVFAVYDLSGRLLKKEVVYSDIAHYYPEINGIYIFEYTSGSQKIHFNK